MNERKPGPRPSARAGGIRLSGSQRRRRWAEASELGRFLVDLSESADPIRLDGLFERAGPLELEIGSGKGAFLVLAAAIFPEVNFVGVEVAAPFARSTADRLLRRGLSNARVVRADARSLVGDRLAPSSVAAVHLYFPDPWPKKRHHKRRLFDAGFLDGVARVLEPHGRLCLATDHDEYYEIMRALGDAHPALELLLAYDWHGPDAGITNFEQKYLREGRTSHRACYHKRG
jgi:tRNA (guanine-N7-)-methyltransferase